MYKKHSIFTNMIALVLALTLPLCCCVVKTAAGAADACNSITNQEEQVQSCCPQQDNEEEPEPYCGDCGCTIKGTIFVQDWAPPVDLIGKEAPAPFFTKQLFLTIVQDAITYAHGPPKYDSHILGFSSAPPIRGTLILEV